MSKRKENIIKLQPKINTDTLDNGNVYMFYNSLFNINLFVNANGMDQAMEKFDLCCFNHRENWRIFLECANQPSGEPNAKKN